MGVVVVMVAGRGVSGGFDAVRFGGSKEVVGFSVDWLRVDSEIL
jgi:hypothetical protein